MASDERRTTATAQTSSTAATAVSEAGAVGAVTRSLARTRLYEWLRLKGYVAFNLPRAVTVLGAVLLLGIAGEHVYVLVSRPLCATPFAPYTAAIVVCCVLSAAAIGYGRNPRISRAAWFCGDGISIVFLGLYLATRPAPLPGMLAVTGRWDVAPGTLAGALALGFLILHMSVLLKINVAYPHRQQWSD